MARTPNLDKHTYAELIELRSAIDALIEQKKAEEKLALKQKLADLAKEQGFDLDEIVGKGRKGGKGTVAIKYRDPENHANTWTGRGRMPRWMAAATKKRGVKKEDFLI